MGESENLTGFSVSDPKREGVYCGLGVLWLVLFVLLGCGVQYAEPQVLL